MIRTCVKIVSEYIGIYAIEISHVPPLSQKLCRMERQTSDHEVFMRLNSGNCEWLVRPCVAISKFASTLNRNLQLLCERPTTFIKQGVVSREHE